MVLSLWLGKSVLVFIYFEYSFRGGKWSMSFKRYAVTVLIHGYFKKNIQYKNWWYLCYKTFLVDFKAKTVFNLFNLQNVTGSICCHWKSFWINIWIVNVLRYILPICNKSCDALFVLTWLKRTFSKTSISMFVFVRFYDINLTLLHTNYHQKYS